MTPIFMEYNQTLNLFKKVDAYGDHHVVVSSSGWFEMEQTIKRSNYKYLQFAAILAEGAIALSVTLSGCALFVNLNIFQVLPSLIVKVILPICM